MTIYYRIVLSFLQDCSKIAVSFLCWWFGNSLIMVIFAPEMSKKKNIIIEKVAVVDAGAKGKSIAKAPDGRVIFLTNAIPGDVVDVQTTKKK